MLERATGNGPEFSNKHTLPSDESGLVGGVQARSPIREVVAAGGALTLSVVAMLSSDDLSNLFTKRVQAAITEPTPMQSVGVIEYKRPEPTPTSSLDPVQVMKVFNYTHKYGQCPSPSEVGKLQVPNPQIVGGLCPGE